MSSRDSSAAVNRALKCLRAVIGPLTVTVVFLAGAEAWRGVTTGKPLLTGTALFVAAVASAMLPYCWRKTR